MSFAVLSAGDKCPFSLSGVKLQLPSSRPVETVCGVEFLISDDWNYVASCYHPPDTVHNGQTFSSRDFLVYALYLPQCVKCKQDRRHQWKLWQISFHRVSLNNMTLNYEIDHVVGETRCWLSYEVSVHPCASDCEDQSPPPYTCESSLDVHQEYSINMALLQCWERLVDCDWCRIDSRPPVSTSILAVA